MKIREILAEGEPILSFEVFPPETEDAYSSVEEAAAKIAKLKPSFMSVAYGAGGGTSDCTVEVTSAIKEEYIMTSLVHLACVSSTREKVHHVLGKLKERDIEDVLAPRGDIPQDDSTPGEYHYISELIREVKEAGDFCIGAVCYSKSHMESADKPVDMDYLRQKVEAECDFVTTQVFLNNSILYSYLHHIRGKGIQVPVIADTMPVINAKQIRRITQMPGVCLPSRLMSIADRFGDNPATIKQAGIAYATGQITGLVANGANGIRVYSMSEPDVAMKIKENLSEILQGDFIRPDTEQENKHMDIHDVDRREILRYLGYRGQEADEAVTVMVEQSMAELWEVAALRHLYREYPLTLGEDYRTGGGCFRAESRNLQGSLKDHDQIVVLAATLGRGADHLIQKYNRLRISQAVVMQAAAATMIEEYCDQMYIVIKSEYEVKGRYLRPRSDPGYRGFSPEYQGMFLKVLEVGKHISIKPTGSLLMMPSRPVPAVMGASGKPYRHGVKGCEACARADCPYRRQ